MEVAIDLSTIFDSEVVTLDSLKLRKMNPRKFNYSMLPVIINKFGQLSSDEQKLRRALTTYEKLIENEDQTLYILWHRAEKPNHSFLIGFLKVGKKRLYLSECESGVGKPVSPVSILDFYVHHDKQRQGYGFQLFDFMLTREKTSPQLLAIDKPSKSLLCFMQKHYHLYEPLWQNNNFVIYPGFWRKDQANVISSNTVDAQIAVSIDQQESNEVVNLHLEQNPKTDEQESIATGGESIVSNAEYARQFKVASMKHQHTTW